MSIGGFVKHTPYENRGKRIPARGYHTITDFVIDPDGAGITKNHHSSDMYQWLDLWNGFGPTDRASRYHTDHAEAVGTKCIGRSVLIAISLSG